MDIFQILQTLWQWFIEALSLLKDMTPVWFLWPATTLIKQAYGLFNQAPGPHSDLLSFIVMFVFSLHIHSLCARICYCFLGKRFGFYHPSIYRFLIWGFPWKTVLYPPLARLKRWREERKKEGKGHTEDWSGPLSTLCNIYKPGKFLLGNFRFGGIGWFAPISIPLTEHAIYVGSNGSGKSTHVLTNIVLHKGPMLAIDPKGEFSDAAYESLTEGGTGIPGQNHDVAVFDPDGLLSHRCHSAVFNVYDTFRWIHKEYGEDALVKMVFRIADALIIEDNKLQPFFTNAAKGFLQGVMLWVYLVEPDHKKNLVRVRELVTQGLHELAGSGENPMDVLML